MPRTRLACLLTGVSLALTLSGCSGSSDDRPVVAPSAALESPPGGSESDPVRAAFIKRAAYETCGKVVLGQRESIEVSAVTRRCLEAARAAGRGAELAVAVPTTEGDPIVHYVRVLPDGSVEVYVDPTADRFAGQDPTWSRQTCSAGTALAVCVPVIFGA